MQHYYNQLKTTGKRLLLIMALYTLCRLLFYVFNHAYFSTSTFSDIILSFIYGIKFDAAAVLATNCLFVLMSILPLKVWAKNWYQKILKSFFIIINPVFLLINCIDFVYFPFIAKRTTSDWFRMLQLGGDMGNLAPQVVKDFWYVLLIWFGMIFLLVRYYKKSDVRSLMSEAGGQKPDIGHRTSDLRLLLLKWLCVPLIIGCCIIIMRGGIQLRPMGMLSASAYVSVKNAPLVLNTPFTVLKTIGKIELDDVKYFTNGEEKKYFTIRHQYKKNEPFKPINVVVIILESFSKEFIGSLNNYPGYTPFLDSLIGQSMACTNAYANSKKSIEGIPAVLASIPALMNEPFITSAYNSNKINSIASLLKKKGYSTAFFHGGNNGTMGFDNFTKSAGFDFYKGRNEYGDKNYDGHWGVYDEDFYKYFLDEMNKMQKPFMTSFFSISSHHPYSVPEKYKGKFKKGTLPIHEGVGYADYALKIFFDEAKKQPWFDNTLFVITADHTSEAEFPAYQSKLGVFAVPIIFYHHNKLNKRYDKVAQHCDILPSIMDYMNYDEPFSAFGNTLFDSTRTNFAMSFLSDSYQLVTDEYLLQFDGEKNMAMYDYKHDALLTKNILPQEKQTAEKNAILLKSIIQKFNHAMIHNEIVKNGY